MHSYRWYAEDPDRRARQVVADLLAAAWTVGAVLTGRAVYATVIALQAPTRTLADAGGRIRDTFSGAADAAGTVPFLGGGLARAFDPGVDAGSGLADAGRQYGATIGTLALVVALVLPVLLLFPVVLGWLPLRLRYARRAGAATAARRDSPDLLALRALTRAPVHRLLAVADDPAAGWREADPDVLRELAALELGGLGLRPPDRVT